MTQTETERHLDLLSTFHFIVGGLAAFFSLFPLIHLTMGILMMTGAFPAQDAEETRVLGVVGGVMILFASLFILAGIAFAICLIAAGRFLRQRRRHTFCVVVAAISCLFVPFGTVLGVLTLIVLMRDETKRMFGEAPPVTA